MAWGGISPLEVERSFWKMQYVFFSPTAFTGGPLAIHQAALEICKNGGIAKIFYFSPKVGSNRIRYDASRVWIKRKWYQPSPSKSLDSYLASFNLNGVEEVNGESVFVVPETSIDIARTLVNGGAKHVYIWWLSVDNVNLSKVKVLETHLSLLQCGHLCQSYYAADFLRGLGIKNIHMLTDFTDIEGDLPDPNASRKHDIAYLPSKAKGSEKVISSLKTQYSVVPLVGMSRAEIKNTLKQTKVFIDFGHHPGKDRIPREAALCGCLPLVRKEGAARFFLDVPLPDDFFIKTSQFLDPAGINAMVSEFVENRPAKFSKLQAYVEGIREEKNNFSQQIKMLMKATL